MILAAVILRRRKIQEIKVSNVFDARARDIECKIVHQAIEQDDSLPIFDEDPSEKGIAIHAI